MKHLLEKQVNVISSYSRDIFKMVVTDIDISKGITLKDMNVNSNLELCMNKKYFDDGTFDENVKPGTNFIDHFNWWKKAIESGTFDTKKYNENMTSNKIKDLHKKGIKGVPQSCAFNK